MVPIAASSQSKSKLKAFQYEQKGPHPDQKRQGMEKENVQPNMEEGGSEMDPPPPPLSQRAGAKDVRDCPQTPAGRLPLSELLASGEDPRQHLNFTPIERVLWDNSPLSPDAPHLAAARKGRKRAYSSSPASSSQNEVSNHFKREKKAIDIQGLQKALKTPKADPASDLWSRYTLNTGTAERRSPTAPAGERFTPFMNSSSPQTPGSHVQKDSGGLRRVLSCIEWSTSAAKRRKLFHNGIQRNSAAEFSNNGGKGAQNPRMSRVSLLVEKVHDGLSKPIISQENDTSSDAGESSPLRRKDEAPSSPTEKNSSLDHGSQRLMDDVANVLSQTAVAPQGGVLQPLILSDEEIATLDKGDSSDFDDDDLDMEMMGGMDEDIRTNVSEDKAGAENHKDSTLVYLQTDRRTTKHSEEFFANETSSSTLKTAPIIHDEFDDDDNEIFAADLEDVCAKYDSQSQPNVEKPTSHKVESHDSIQLKSLPAFSHDALPVEIEVLSDDDDFGNDSDFEQLAAECAEATQGQQLSEPQSSVRTLKLSPCT